MSAAALRRGVSPRQRPAKGIASPDRHRRLRTLPLPFLTEPEPAESELAQSDLAQSDLAEPDLAQSALAQPASVPRKSHRPAVVEEPLHHPPEPTASSGPADSPRSAQQALMAQLTREVQRIEVSGRGRAEIGQGDAARALFSSGCGEMDRCLPSGGYDAGTVVEYLQTSSASGATSLALIAAREALTATDRFCVLVDWREQFYPPAAAALGIDLKRVIIVRPATLAERLWAIDQALRSPAIAAVIAEVEQLDDRAARRLQLAAERGGGVGLLIRRRQAAQHPSWAEVQWLVRPLAERSAHRQLKLELMRARGGRSGASVRVQINALHGRIEAVPAAAAVLARTLARPRPSIAQRQERSA